MAILFTLLIVLIIVALVWWRIGIIPLPPPLVSFRWVLYAILIIILIVYLLGLIGVHVP